MLHIMVELRTGVCAALRVEINVTQPLVLAASSGKIIEAAIVGRQTRCLDSTVLRCALAQGVDAAQCAGGQINQQ